MLEQKIAPTRDKERIQLVWCKAMKKTKQPLLVTTDTLFAAEKEQRKNNSYYWSESQNAQTGDHDQASTSKLDQSRPLLAGEYKLATASIMD